MYTTDRPFLFSLLILLFALKNQIAVGQDNSSQKKGVLQIISTADFIPTGDGNSDNWKKADWNILPQHSYETLKKENWDLPSQGSGLHYETSFKVLYSAKGIYCLYKCEDSLITATLKGDFLNLYDEDVVEVFLQPDTSLPVYFEYELSPLNYELPILIINKKGDAAAWKPLPYEGSRKTIHAIKMGKKNTTDNRLTWTAEFFIPYSLLTPLTNGAPVKGTQWHANFYRIDYDNTPMYSGWQLTKNNFHDPERFGILEFE